MTAGGASIGYARVSTQDQDLSLQSSALEAAGCRRIFADVASGAKTARPELDKALEHLRPGDTLVVWKIDRLGRSTSHLIEVVEGLKQRGVGFRSLTEAGIDTTTPGGTLFFTIFAALAEFERAIIRERTRAGLDAARSRGSKAGRKPKVTPEVFARFKALRTSGLTIPEAAAVLKVGQTALYKALKEEKAARDA